MTRRLTLGSRRLRVALGLGLGLVALYGMAGFFVAPGIVQRNLVRQFAATLHRPVTVQRVHVNPFALSVTVDSLRVTDRDGGDLFGWDRFYVNLEIISILRRELDLEEVRLIHPFGRTVLRRDGTLNVSDIVDSLNASRSSGPLPVLAIDGLHIENARWVFYDSANTRNFVTTIGPWRIDLASFATRRDNSSRYTFSGRTESGESFAWAGTLGIDPLRTSGEFSLDSLKLQKYRPFFERTVSFDVPRGIASLKAGYELNFAPSGRVLRLRDAALRVGDLTIVERGHSDTVLAVPLMEVTGVSADMMTRRATVGLVRATGGVIRTQRSRDRTINLIRMMATPIDSSAPRPRLVTTTSSSARPRAPWQWLVGRVAADSMSVAFLDSAAGRPARIALASVSATLDTIASDSNARTQLHAAFTWQPRGTARVEGTLAIWRLSGDVTVVAQNLALSPLDAYLAPRVNLLIADGRLSSDAKIRFAFADTAHPDVQFKGNVIVGRFATVDAARKDPFLAFHELRVSGIDYALRARRLSMRDITLDAPTLDVGVTPDGTPVVRSIFPRPGADSAAGDSASRDSTARPAAATPAPAAPASGAPAAPALRANIGRIRVTGGAIRVNDRSLDPPVVFSLSKIDALTGRLSSDSLGVGSLELTASIDDVAPVAITGRFNPLSSKEGSDLIVKVEGMELIPVGPYSGKYLGYAIAKGKMRVDMQYRVLGRKLSAENKLTLDGFTFGEATTSPEATKMPVKLGFALLRDRSGQIVFDVPVEGDLDDPNFRIGRVVGRAILNVLTKLVTSPFKLLGGIFGGGETADLSFVGFAPGGATLDPEATKKLDVLVKSLVERPELKLEIAGAVDTVADPAALRMAKVDAQLRVRKWSALKAKDPNVPPPDSLPLTPTDRPLWLAMAFAAAFPTDSAVQAAKKAKSLLPPYPPSEMERRLASTLDISLTDLRLLADARAKRCLEYLLSRPNQPVSPERAFLTAGGEKRDGARADFTLQ